MTASAPGLRVAKRTWGMLDFLDPGICGPQGKVNSLWGVGGAYLEPGAPKTLLLSYHSVSKVSLRDGISDRRRGAYLAVLVYLGGPRWSIWALWVLPCHNMAHWTSAVSMAYL